MAMTSSTGDTAKIDYVSEDSIRRLVDGFYAKVRRDPELAPISCAPFPATGSRI